MSSDYADRLLMAVTALTAEMGRASTKNEVLSLLAAWIPLMLPADRATIAFASGSDHLEIRALEGNLAVPKGEVLPIGITTTGTAFREKRVIRIDDTATQETLDDELLASNHLRSSLSAPLINQGDVIGTLNIAHREVGIYSAEHEVRLAHVAGFAAAQLALLDRFFEIQDNLEAKVAARTQELEDQKVQLELALEREQELNSLQSRFVSMVSHEFRTPLAIIDGNAQRLERRHDKTTSEQLLSGLGKIRIGVTRLTTLVEGVLSAARLEGGNINFDPGPCDVSRLISETCDKHQKIHPDHKILMDLDKLPAECCVDSDLMRQVISNLVSNAIKYSQDGVHIWVEGGKDDEGNVTITVRDEGPGIPKPELARLFDRFFRASTSIGIIGTGVGLHVVRALVRLHGGTVDVDSIVGEGTTFTVRLPTQQPKMADSEEKAA